MPLGFNWYLCQCNGQMQLQALSDHLGSSRKLKLNTSGGEYLVKRDEGLRKAYNFNRNPAMCKLTVGTPTNNQPLLLVATESIYKFSYGSTADSYGRQKLNTFGWKKQSEGAIKQ